jgi:hypothetical protein
MPPAPDIGPGRAVVGRLIQLVIDIVQQTIWPLLLRIELK